MDSDPIKNFLVNSSETGKHIVFSIRTGKKYYVEPIGNGRSDWGDIDVATKTVTGDYGQKYTGSVLAKDSVITEENGFKNIQFVESGSPYHLIDEIDAKYPSLK
ncbi:MAG: hypothetical protein WC979_00690 [Candidatus Pacearchaeota archaeon]|jgi:hypothetical protein|nr:hypothetical protein [Clostridia bacterium]